jgi:hypothetical protein
MRQQEAINWQERMPAVELYLIKKGIEAQNGGR